MKSRFWFRSALRQSLLLLPIISAFTVCADQVETVTGDHYVGKVISLNSSTLILQSDVLGTVRVPRGKVTSIQFGTNTAAAVPGTNSLTTAQLPKQFSAETPAPVMAPAMASVPHRGSQEFSNAVAQLSANRAMADQVRMQMLAGAGPGANAKFEELLNGLANGRISLGDLRAQAKTSADQIRAMQKELGGDAGGALDGYLSILESFIHEADSAGAASTSTNSVLKLLEADP